MMNFNQFVDSVLSVIGVSELSPETEASHDIKKLQEDANQDMPSAQYLLGRYYHFGVKVEKDIKQAFYWYGRAANAGLSIAQYQLGLIYVEGAECPPDYQLAKSWLELSAEQDFQPSIFLLSLLEAKGLLAECDPEHVFYMMRKAALLGNVEALVGTGLACVEGYGCEVSYADALRWIVYARMKSEESQKEINIILHQLLDKIEETLPEKDIDTLTAYAYCLELGIRFEKDTAKSVLIYHTAAKMGNAFAQNALSHCYMVPLHGLEKDLEKAYYLSAGAAQKGNISAMVNVGYFYELGENSEHLGHMDFIKQNLDKAEYWYRKAADAGHVKANLYLSSVYSRRRDMANKLKYMKKAAELNDGEAQMLMFEYLMDENPGEAFYWLSRAIKNNYGPAMEVLNNMIEQTGEADE